MPGRTRTLLLVAIAAAAGLGIAYLDSRPGWDDTGITGLLIGGLSAAFAFAAGRRPWLWALLVGGWVPLLEITGQSGAYSLLALLFGAVGALTGWAVARVASSGQPATRSR